MKRSDKKQKEPRKTTGETRASSSGGATCIRPAPFKKTSFIWGALAILCVVVLGVFSSSLSGGLIWDDKDLIENDPRIRDFSDFGGLWAGLFAMADDQSIGINYYRPLTTFTFMINHAMSGADPVVYHWTNVLIHLLSTVLVFFLARALLLKPWPCLVVALLFALHPSRTENVAWISGRTDLLAGMFLFLSFLLYLMHDRCGKAKHLWLSVLAFVAALFAKESALPFPLVLALYAVIVGRRRTNENDLEDNNPKESKRAWRLSKIWIYFAISGLFLLLLRLMGAFEGSSNYTFDSMSQHLLYIFHTLKLYLAILFWPIEFHYIATAILPDGLNYFSFSSGAGTSFLWVIALFLLTLWIWFLKKKPLVSFCLLAWIVALIPALNIVPLPCTVSIRHVYVPLFFVIVAGWCLWETIVAMILKGESKADIRQYIQLGLPLVIASIFGWVSFQQNGNWHNEDRFWNAQLEACPDSANVHCHMGLIMQEKNLPEDALAHFKNARELAPGNKLFLLYCGNGYKAMKRYNEAEECYLEALKDNPGFGKAVNRLAVLYDVMGKPQAAQRYFAQSIEFFPNNAGYRKDFGIFHFNRGNYSWASAQFEVALKLEPQDIQVYEYLGLAYEQQATPFHMERAEETYKKGLALDPGNKQLKMRLQNLQRKS